MKQFAHNERSSYLLKNVAVFCITSNKKFVLQNTFRLYVQTVQFIGASKNMDSHS